MLARAADAARQAVQDYLSDVRTRHNQHWLGHSGAAPRITGLTHVVERESGERYRTGYQDPVVLRGLGQKDALDLAHHESIVSGIRKDYQEPTANALLADAKFLSWIAEPPQPREAILLAAIACEVKIKQSLRLACPPEAAPILAWALDNPREVTQQAVGLYHKMAKAVTGRSLHEEDRGRYKDLAELFEARNAVAHKASEVPSSDILRTFLSAAEFALGWCDSLHDHLEA